MTPLIRAEDAGVRFHFDRHRRVVTPSIARLRRRGTTAWGLRHATFSAEPGDSIALLGPSGSGKTTLLRALAGVYVPDAGRLEVHGRVASLLSIEAGLISLLTGRENALLLGVLAGLSRAECRGSLERVKRESGLGDAFENPVASFSQGMRARVSLAVAELVDPDILLLDEVHEALDHEFRNVLEERAHEIVAAGGVVVAAGHDHPMLERLCTRAILLRHGTIEHDGDFREVQRTYVEAAA